MAASSAWWLVQVVSVAFSRLKSVFKRSRWWVIFLVLFGMASVGYLLRDTLLGTPVKVYQVHKLDLQQSIVASGRIVTPQRVAIAAELSGRVLRVPVDEGQTVRRGDELVVLDGSSERAAVEQAVAAHAQAVAALRQQSEFELPAARQALKQAQTNAAQARREFERTRDLNARGFIGQSQLDEARRALSVADSLVQTARLQVQSKQADGSELALAEAKVEQAKASLGLALATLERITIVAPADGVLISRDVEPGDVVQAGRTLMALAASGQVQILVRIDEKHLGKIALGQTAIGSADAYPERRFDAVVSYINPGIDPTRGTVDVKLEVSEAPDYLRQDMTVSVDIATASVSDALVVPAEAINREPSSDPWILTIKDGRAHRQPVGLGLQGDQQVEVLEGLEEGRLVILPDAIPVLPGSRVRVPDQGSQ